MSMTRWLAACLSFACFSLAANAADSKAKKRLLLVTDSGGFIHDSVGLAEQNLKKLGPDNGFDVECFRFTRDPENTKVFDEYAARFRKTTGVPVEKENCGRVNAATLKKFDVVLFFTTGNPLDEQEVKDLVAWVKAGGAVAGTHCGSDTLYPDKNRPWQAAYGDLIGAYFDGHPWHQKIKIKVEDSKHAAGHGFKDGDEVTDEIYQFRPEPYSRGKLHIILSVDNSSIDVTKGKRKDHDYAISWCQEVDKGRTFYTSLGHRKEVWNDKRFQEHLFGGLKWCVKEAEGSATPSAALQN
jgi:type 1 glutamine amidotransferase